MVIISNDDASLDSPRSYLRGSHSCCFDDCRVLMRVIPHFKTSSWSSGKCVRFGAGRSRVRLSAGAYQDLVNWYCSLLTRRTMCGRTAGNTPRTQKQTRNCKNSVVALQDHCSQKKSTFQTHTGRLRAASLRSVSFVSLTQALVD